MPKSMIVPKSKQELLWAGFAIFLVFFSLCTAYILLTDSSNGPRLLDLCIFVFLPFAIGSFALFRNRHTFQSRVLDIDGLNSRWSAASLHFEGKINSEHALLLEKSGTRLFGSCLLYRRDPAPKIWWAPYASPPAGSFVTLIHDPNFPVPRIKDNTDRRHFLIDPVLAILENPLSREIPSLVLAVAILNFSMTIAPGIFAAEVLENLPYFQALTTFGVLSCIIFVIVLGQLEHKQGRNCVVIFDRLPLDRKLVSRTVLSKTHTRSIPKLARVISMGVGSIALIFAIGTITKRRDPIGFSAGFLTFQCMVFAAWSAFRGAKIVRTGADLELSDDAIEGDTSSNERQDYVSPTPDTFWGKVVILSIYALSWWAHWYFLKSFAALGFLHVLGFIASTLRWRHYGKRITFEDIFYSIIFPTWGITAILIAIAGSRLILGRLGY